MPDPLDTSTPSPIRTLPEPHAGDDGWQDIATAPKDGTEVDLWWPAQIGREGRREANVHWDRFDGFWRRRDRSHCIYGVNPTHWRPLPTPPAGVRDNG